MPRSTVPLVALTLTLATSACARRRGVGVPLPGRDETSVHEVQRLAAPAAE